MSGGGGGDGASGSVVVLEAVAYGSCGTGLAGPAPSSVSGFVAGCQRSGTLSPCIIWESPAMLSWAGSDCRRAGCLLCARADSAGAAVVGGVYGGGGIAEGRSAG